MKLYPSQSCADSQHRLGVAALYRIAETERVADLEKRLFSGSQRAAIPAAAKTKPKTVKAPDSFNSLAAAFGGLQGADAPVHQEETSSATKSSGKERPPASLSKTEILLLSSLGDKPRRNRSDLITHILMRTLGAPRTEGEWDAAVEKARPGLADTAAAACASLARILTVAENISRLLCESRPGYEESLEDAQQHFDQLLAPGWLLQEGLGEQLTNLRGLEMRLTRMFGSPPAKDLTKLERYQASAAEIWADEAECECGGCQFPARYIDQLNQDADLRLREFAQELRRST